MAAVAAPADPTTLTTNSVPPNSVSITQGSAGQPSLIAPQLLILGVPNDTTNLFPTNPISSVTYSGTPPVPGSSGFATAGTYGLTPPVDLGFFGDFTALNTGSVYDFLTLQGPTDNSNTFSNWQKRVLKFSSISASNFGIYVFALTGHTLDPKATVTIGFSPVPPNGTFPVGYGQDGAVPPAVFDMSVVSATILNLAGPAPLTFWDGPGRLTTTR